MVLGWHQAGTGKALRWHLDGIRMAQRWQLDGTGMAQGWHRDGTDKALRWHLGGIEVALGWQLGGTELAPGWWPQLSRARRMGMAWGGDVRSRRDGARARGRRETVTEGAMPGQRGGGWQDTRAPGWHQPGMFLPLVAPAGPHWSPPHSQEGDGDGGGHLPALPLVPTCWFSSLCATMPRCQGVAEAGPVPWG